MAALLKIRDLRVSFSIGSKFFGRGRNVRAVDGIDLDVTAGETLAIVGESGCGKTTLGRTIAMLQRPSSGSVEFMGVRLERLRSKDLRDARRSMQMIFQDPNASLDPRQSVEAIVTEPLLIAGASTALRKQRAAELLDVVGLGAEAGMRLPRAFSGGQRQRIGIARALAASPKLIICDEPLSALDVSIQAQIVNLLVDLQRRFGLTYIFISHDLAVVRQMASRIAVMYLGTVVELADAERLFAAPRHPYTVALLSAVPTLGGPVHSAMEPLLASGDPPSPLNMPRGCRFHPRCWLRKKLGDPAICTSQEPRLVATDTHQAACHFADETAAHAAAPLPVAAEAF